MDKSAAKKRHSPYALLQRAKRQSIPALAPPRLPAEMRRPRPALRSVLKKCSERKRARIALALAQELAALHADGTSVGRLSPDVVHFGMTGYPEIAQIGEAEPDSAYTAPELLDRRASSRRPHGTPCGDVYGFGALLYFILTGRQPPRSWTPRAFSRLSPTAASLVMRCVHEDPWSRPKASLVAEELEAAGPERLRSDAGAIELVRRKPKRAWNVASAVALTGTAAALLWTGVVTHGLGALGLAAMVVGASISAGGG